MRTCPQCMSQISPGEVVAYSDGIECPVCEAPLEVSPGSRVLATVLGLTAAYLVWRITSWSHGGALDWVLPIVYSFLAFSAVAPLFLMFTADLVNRPAGPPAAMAAEPAPGAAGHLPGGSHH